MDPKNWRWRRRSSEKTITTSNRVGDDVLNQAETKIQAIPVEEESRHGLSVKSLNHKLASVLVDSHDKDETVADSEKAEMEAEQLRLQLDDAWKEVAAANGNSSRLETQLKECNDHLIALHEDSNRMIHDAVFETSRDFLESQKNLEDKLSESNKKLVAMSAELSVKGKLIEDLSKCKSQAEAEFNALMGRLDSIEKENAFLKYEFCLLEKELAIRNEELEYNRQAADSSHKKHLESLKKVGKLEGEIHQLRVLMQKKLPGPASMAKMKNEVKLLGREQTDTARRRNPELTKKSPSLQGPSNKVNYLVEKLFDVEEENKALKELVARKETELDSSRALCSKTSSRVSELKARLAGQGMELVKIDEGGNRANSSGSWANALISELEKLNPVEIDKLALVSVSPPENGSKTTQISFDWLQVVLNAMTEQTRISNRSLLELFEDISIALGFMNQSNDGTGDSGVKISGYLPWKSPSSSSKTLCEEDDHRSESVEVKLSKSVQKLARLIESFVPTKADYFVRVFQWKSSELSVIQQRFLRACNDLMDEKWDVETFVGELADALEWIMSSDSTPKNASNARDRIKRRINFTDSPTKDDLEDHWPQTAEEKLKSANEELEKAEQCIRSLRLEVEELKEAKLAIEDQMENLKVINDDLDTELSMTKAKLNEVLQKFSSLEVELEEKKNCCEELESTCLELQLQLESVVKETPKHHDQMTSQTGWEITAASVKLAECQETIVNLGRQLKALASPRERSFFEKVLNPPNSMVKKNLSKRCSLRDRMLAEDDSKPRNAASYECRDDRDGQRHKYTSSYNNAVALAIVPSKKQNGIGFLRRMLLRRRRGSIRKSSFEKTTSLHNT